MFETMKKTALEVIQSMSPIIVVIVILQFTVIHAPVDVFLRFLIGAAMTVFGASFFLLGVRTGILPIGRDIGAEIPQHGSVILIIFVGLVFGFAVTAAEPGVLVLQSMAVEAGINNSDALVFVVATGMALLFTSALIRILFGFPIRYLLAIIYTVALILAFFVPAEFLPIAFDSGGVAAGAFTVPMLLALGMGFTSVLAHRSSLSDGFGLIGIACAGPIIGLLLWGVFFF
ncbi:MAG: DUF1538 domain-containing protein [Dehalococcoidales bacterium]|nr:DUF1538 domain-containing protein [Dehalococcoidales bacterium]